jgi:hypothetical protein
MSSPFVAEKPMSQFMTESQWLSATSTYDMLQYLGKSLSDRKRVLFGCATARQTWPLISKAINRQAVQTSERYADGLASKENVLQAWSRLDWEPAMYVEWHIGTVTAGLSYRSPTPEETMHKCLSDFPQRRSVEQRHHAWADALREIVGNPFQQPRIDPAWLMWNARIVARLSQVIYDEHRWEDMPILGDALEEAGCRDENILSHCRQSPPHYRGCWVVDLVLARS